MMQLLKIDVFSLAVEFYQDVRICSDILVKFYSQREDIICKK